MRRSDPYAPRGPSPEKEEKAYTSDIRFHTGACAKQERRGPGPGGGGPPRTSADAQKCLRSESRSADSCQR